MKFLRVNLRKVEIFDWIPRKVEVLKVIQVKVELNTGKV